MRFQNHSDGTLISYKANDFGFFLTLSTNALQMLVMFVCLVSGMKSRKKSELLYSFGL